MLRKERKEDLIMMFKIRVGWGSKICGEAIQQALIIVFEVCGQSLMCQFNQQSSSTIFNKEKCFESKLQDSMNSFYFENFVTDEISEKSIVLWKLTFFLNMPNRLCFTST